MAVSRDLVSLISVQESIRPAVYTASQNGQGVDLRGYQSVAFLTTVGAVAGAGNVTVKLQESDDNATFTDVAAADLQGAFPAALAQNTTYKVGYIGAKRYVRAVGTLNSGTSVAYSVLAALGRPALGPAA